jgi:hypothetical protein
VIAGQYATLALMLEYLAIPAWNARPASLDAWTARLTEFGGPVVVTRDSSTSGWLEVASLRLRGYILLYNGKASAINFELHDPDPGPATLAIEAAAKALGWEIHPDDDDDDDDDEDEDED